MSRNLFLSHPEKLKRVRLLLPAARALLLVLLCCALASVEGAGQTPSVYNRLERTAQLIRQGQLSKAEAELNQILRQSPREANAFNLLGVVRAQQQQPAQAEKLFLRALELSPALFGAYLNLGQLYLTIDKTDRALWAFTEASKLQPDNPDISYNLAALYLKRQDYRASLDHLEKIPRQLYSADHMYLLIEDLLGLGRIDEAQSLIAPLKQPGTVPAEAAARFAIAFARHNLPDSAIEILEAAKQQSPDSFPVLYNLGTVYSQKGEQAKAEQYYQAALKLKPDDVQTLRALAGVARKSGEMEKALSFLVRARKLAPDSPQVLYDFGWTALSLNLLFDAIQVLQRLHDMHPDEPGYLYALAIARLNNGEGPRAQALLKRYIELRPQDARGYFVLGATLYSLKQFAEARAALERSLELTPYADTEYYLGMIAHNEGDETRALMRLQRALEADPSHAAAHTALGIIYLAQKKYEEARAALEQAIKLDPHDTKAHYQLGIVYARMGEKQRSQEMFALYDKLRKEEQEREVIGFRLIDPPN